MPTLSEADHATRPPTIHIPRQYNAADDLIERNLLAGRGTKTAYIDDNGEYTYHQLALQINRCASGLRNTLALRQEDRILLCLHDTIAFPVAFLGAIKAGVIPIAVNTLLTQHDYEYMLTDSRATVAVVSAALLPLFTPLLDKVPTFKRLIVANTANPGPDSLHTLLASGSDHFETAPTLADDVCFWLYSSGSTGAPKGTVHIHSSLIQTYELYAKPTLAISESDIVFSAAKLFFAYGLGNGLTFPLAAGATTILMAERPTPAAVFQRLLTRQPTIFYGVPTLYASMLASPDCPAPVQLNLRTCTSAGEALPEEIGKRWHERFGVDILDGIGSTEMLHIFLSNRTDDLRYGTTGKAVPGYTLRLIDDDGLEITDPGQPGELQICGPTTAVYYWNNREKTRSTFQGPWTRSGDKYLRDADGYYVYAGRNDDMLKVSGIYVSPIEVESALITHEAVLEAAVIGHEDDDKLIKPKAFIVLKPGFTVSPELRETLKQHVKNLLAPYKYPRWMEFVEELPKTATGKILRFKLRRAASH